MAVKRGSLACCACDGLVYAVGGAFCFSSATHLPLLLAISCVYAVACTWADEALLALGWDNESSVATVEAYDVRGGRWRFVAPMSEGCVTSIPSLSSCGCCLSCPCRSL